MRAMLTLPRDSFDKLIALEDQPKYLEYLPVRPVPPAAKAEPDIPFVLRSHWKRWMMGPGRSLSGYTWDTYHAGRAKGGWTTSQESLGTVMVPR